MFWEARGKAAVIWSGVKLTNRAKDLASSILKNVRTLSGLPPLETRGCAQISVVGAVSIGPFELSRSRPRRTRSGFENLAH